MHASNAFLYLNIFRMYQKFAQLVSFFCFFIGFSFFALRKLLCKLSNLMYTIKKIELCEIYTFFLSILVFQKLFDIIFYCSPIWTFLRNHWTELYAPLRRRCWCRYVSFQVFFLFKYMTRGNHKSMWSIESKLSHFVSLQ